MQNQNNTYDYLIIGAGPAGLQMGYFLEKCNLNYAILEASDVSGSFFQKYPRMNQLISFNKKHSIYNHPEIKLRWDWNSLLTDNYEFPFGPYSDKLYPTGTELQTYLQDFANHFDLNIIYNTRIEKIEKNDGVFKAIDSNQNLFQGKVLLVGTGVSKPYVPDIPGIELVTEGYENVSLDKEEFLGQRVLILGKGNSAFEIADNLLDTTALIHLASPKSIKFAWETRFAGNTRANYSRILDTYQLKLLNGTLDCHILKIERRADKFIATISYIHAEGEIEEIEYDRVIRCTGFSLDTKIFDESCEPEPWKDPRFPNMTSDYESANVKNMYFIGTLMQIRDFRTASSAFIDGFRYNIKFLSSILKERYSAVEFPYTNLSGTLEEITSRISDRISTNSGLWTQFSYMSDVLVVENQNIKYYEEMPIDYAKERFLNHDQLVFFITFEWGYEVEDVFNMKRNPKHQNANQNSFLHPIIRVFENGEMIEDHHILEELFGMYQSKLASNCVVNRYFADDNENKLNKSDWHKNNHEIPLLEFFSKYLVPSLEVAEV